MAASSSSSASASHDVCTTLSLDPPSADKVPNSYRQIIKSQGRKLVIQTSEHFTETGLRFYSKGTGNWCVCVPLDDWLRSQLLLIQNFVQANVAIPQECVGDKPIIFKGLSLHGDSILMSVSHWCRFFKYVSEKGLYLTTPNCEDFAGGNYTLNVEVSHVYIGPHKNGETYSISLRVSQITYKEMAQADSVSQVETIAKELDDALEAVEKAAKSKKGRKWKEEAAEPAVRKPKIKRAAALHFGDVLTQK